MSNIIEAVVDRNKKRRIDETNSYIATNNNNSFEFFSLNCSPQPILLLKVNSEEDLKHSPSSSSNHHHSSSNNSSSTSTSSRHRRGNIGKENEKSSLDEGRRDPISIHFANR